MLTVDWDTILFKPEQLEDPVVLCDVKNLTEKPVCFKGLVTNNRVCFISPSVGVVPPGEGIKLNFSFNMALLGEMDAENKKKIKNGENPPYPMQIMIQCAEIDNILATEEEIRKNIEEKVLSLERHKITFGVADLDKALEEACKAFDCRLTEKAQLGKGSFGAVMKVVKNGTNEPRALKLSWKDPSDRRVENYLRMEAELQTHFVHPNIVHAFGSYEGKSFIAVEMELCDMNLQKYTADNITRVEMKEKKKNLSFAGLPEEKLRPLSRQILRGLATIHERRVFHRDIKPENILISMKDDVPTAKIGDFGLAKIQTVSNFTNVGTPAYAAPEILSSVPGRRVMYDSRCDIYSLGVAFFLMLTGQYPSRMRNVSYSKLPDECCFSDVCNHFISHMIVFDPQHRMNSTQALHHPFVMPRLRVVQMVEPDAPYGIRGSKIHTIELGDLAFKNAATDPDIMDPYKHEYPTWKVTWEDVLSYLNLDKTDDYVIITNDGKVSNKKDNVEINDEDIDAVIVSKLTPIPRFDADVDVFKPLNPKDDDVINQSVLRYQFCDNILRNNVILDHFKRVITPDFLVKRLFELQNELVQLAPGFPTVAYTEPEHGDLKIETGSDKDCATLKVIEEEVKKVESETKDKNAKLFLKSLQPTEVRKITWEDEVWNECLHHSVEVLFNMFKLMEADIEIIISLVSYIDILKHAKLQSVPQSVLKQLKALAVKSPYLQMCSFSSTDDDVMVETNSTVNRETSELQQALEAQQELYSMLSSQVSELQEWNQKLSADSKKYIEKCRDTIYKLQMALLSNGTIITDM